MINLKNRDILRSTIKEQMVEISRGEIDLRDDRTKQRWTVEIAPFFMSKFPVTQDLYFEVTKERPSTIKGNRRPVETITWIEAISFCNALSLLLERKPCYRFDDNNGTQISFNQGADGFRLPTEAEWEYACKAGTTGIRYGELDSVAWYKENSNDATHNVGQKQPNAWGLYDMLGNVWEWCADLYDTEVYGSYRIFRGGGWSDEGRSVMATTRRRSHPLKFKIEDLGFRMASNKSG